MVIKIFIVQSQNILENFFQCVANVWTFGHPQRVLLRSLLPPEPGTGLIHNMGNGSSASLKLMRT